MARPRTEPPESRRRHILEAARSLLVQKDYNDIVLDEVARQANIAKGTLYLYFRSKDHLLSAVLEDIMARLHAQVADCGVPTDAPLGVLRAFAEVHLVFMDENHDFMTQILRQDPVLGRGGASPLRKAFDGHLKVLTEHIRAAMDRGALRRQDPGLGAFYFMTLLRMFMVRKVMKRSKRPLRRDVDQFLELFLNGLGGRER